MGSINSNNPAHLDNGVCYRNATKRINKMIAEAKARDNHPIMRQCHDRLLAQKCLLSATLLSNSGSGLLLYSGNITARDFGQLAYDLELFISEFDKLVKEVRKQ